MDHPVFSPIQIQNDEIRMTNDEGMKKTECRKTLLRKDTLKLAEDKETEENYHEGIACGQRPPAGHQIVIVRDWSFVI